MAKIPPDPESLKRELLAKEIENDHRRDQRRQNWEFRYNVIGKGIAILIVVPVTGFLGYKLVVSPSMELFWIFAGCLILIVALSGLSPARALRWLQGIVGRRD